MDIARAIGSSEIKEAAPAHAEADTNETAQGETADIPTTEAAADATAQLSCALQVSALTLTITLT